MSGERGAGSGERGAGSVDAMVMVMARVSGELHVSHPPPHAELVRSTGGVVGKILHKVEAEGIDTIRR